VGVVGDPNSKRPLVLMSGTHGVEGFCGSAIQTNYLKTVLAVHPSNTVATMFVHGINSYGFSYLRRANENNIDLNRNFIDFNHLPNNAAYAKLAGTLARKPGAGTRASIAWQILKSGLRTVQDAFTRGQYDYPVGLFYGGREASWSRGTWEKILATYLSRAKAVFYIDYHTGLGPYGYGQAIYPGSANSPLANEVRRVYSEVKFLKTNDAVATPPTGDILEFTMISRVASSLSFFGSPAEFVGKKRPFWSS